MHYNEMPTARLERACPRAPDPKSCAQRGTHARETSNPIPTASGRVRNDTEKLTTDLQAVAARIVARCVVDDETGCWLFMGARNNTGYGQIRVGGAVHKAHRIMLMSTGVSLDGGLFACHHCDTPACVNPAHLYAGTPKQNSQDAKRRMRSPAQRQTHCKRGHAFTPENTYIIPAHGRAGGGRQCRRCVGSRANAEVFAAVAAGSDALAALTEAAR
jgi:hypothetical protein